MVNYLNNKRVKMVKKYKFYLLKTEPKIQHKKIFTKKNFKSCVIISVNEIQQNSTEFYIQQCAK